MCQQKGKETDYIVENIPRLSGGKLQRVALVVVRWRKQARYPEVGSN